MKLKFKTVKYKAFNQAWNTVRNSRMDVGSIDWFLARDEISELVRVSVRVSVFTTVWNEVYETNPNWTNGNPWI